MAEPKITWHLKYKDNGIERIVDLHSRSECDAAQEAEEILKSHGPAILYKTEVKETNSQFKFDETGKFKITYLTAEILARINGRK